MKLCVMRDQMHAKLPDGVRCKFVFPGDVGHPLLKDPVVGSPCDGCVLNGRCHGGSDNRCTPQSRHDCRRCGIWIREVDAC